MAKAGAGGRAGENYRSPALAKINLYLHVTGRRKDGYHLLDSLIAFAGVGDEIRAEPNDALSLTIEGPRRGDIPGGEDNLVLRAARRLAQAAGVRAGARLTLSKHLPV
jgi:4-diphosphocytidyl-2-C-methyl-D-erythritol kinase